METEKIQSKALAYIEQKAWDWKPSGTDQAQVAVCPCCGNSNSKFYMNIGGGASDGLWNCFVCGEKGSLYQIRLKLGDRDAGLVSTRDMALASGGAPPLPDVGPMHHRLTNDERFADVLDYLVHDRGFTLEVIERMKLGAEEDFGQKWVVYPYFNKQGGLTFVKYRNLPPNPKEFRACSGREAQLYNENCIVVGLAYLIFVEGESDCLACLSQGIESVVGIPGANTKKATWITKVDNAKAEKLYLLYDNDKVGQVAAKEMAKRIGIEKVFNICLPEFKRKDGEKGKDINEWFRAGHTLEEFEILKMNAQPFDVDGVKGIPEVIKEIVEDIELRGTKRYELDTPWPSLTAKLGGANYGEMVGLIAEGKVGKTTMAMNWLSYYAVEHGLNGLLYCLEMTQKALVRKWVSHVTGTDDDKITKETVQKALQIAESIPGELLFGFSRSDPKEVMETIRQAVRRYGVKVVVFDNLQFLVRSLDHATQETGNLSKQFHDLATELGILLILVVQPNRVREGEIVSARNAMNSSAIEKDVDAMIALHRNRVAKIKQEDFKGYLEADENFEPQLLCRVDLSRYAPGGVCTLWMDGAKSTVREFQDQDSHGDPRASKTFVIPTEGQPEITI